MATIEKRTGRDGQTTFRVKVRLKGHPAQTATFKRLTDARKWAKQTEVEIDQGRYFRTAEAKKHTLADLVDRYRLDVLPRKGRQRENQAHQLDWWKERLGAYSLSDVSPSLLAEHRDLLTRDTTHLGQHRSPATANRYLATLSHAFTVAVNEWGWLEDNPMRKVARLREPRGRVRFLSDDERTRLLTACRGSRSPHLYPVVILALATGMRQGEILGLKWTDMDTVQGRITLHHTKNGERRVVPLVGEALRIVKEHASVRRIDSDLVFPGKNSKRPADIRDAWLKTLERAEIDDFRFHDLRHSAASYLAMNGASLAEIAEVLGHKTLQMVQRYAHLSEAHTTGVVTRMNAVIFGE